MYYKMMNELYELLEEYETCTDNIRRSQIEDRCKDIETWLDTEFF